MINFSCSCRTSLSVPAELAGDEIQCPTCHRLVTVPLLADLRALDEDGTFKLDALPLKADRDRVAKVTRAFTRQTTNDAGESIDMRNDIDEFLAAGISPEIPLTADEVEDKAPHYDPMTGELVEPLRFNNEVPFAPRTGTAAARALAAAKNPPPPPKATQTLSYANNPDATSTSYLGVFAGLFRAPNLLVMGFMLFAHLLLIPLIFQMMLGFFFIAFIVFLGYMAILAHYVNVIDETGPSEMDELPRPLRDVSVGDDIWRPFTQLAGASMFCFFPAALALALSPPGSAVHAFAPPVLALIGLFFFPATLLTLATSGAYNNAAPWRILYVIRICGAKYLIAVVVWLLAVLAYFPGVHPGRVDLLDFLPTSMKNNVSQAHVWFPPMLAWLALPAAIYLTHAACWMLGKLWVAHHAEFPWVLQRHIRKDRTDTMSQLDQRRMRNRALSQKYMAQGKGKA